MTARARTTRAAFAAALLAACASATPTRAADFSGAFAGFESVASPDGPATRLLNPAAAGLRYPSEFALTLRSLPSGDDLYSGALAAGGFRLLAAAGEHHRSEWGASLAGGDAPLRVGASVTTLRAGGRAVDTRLGLLSRPLPWLSLGAVAEHANRPRLGGESLERAYTLGLGLRPLAWSRVAAHTWGTRLTLTGDAVLREDAHAEDATFRWGAQAEVLPGIALRGLYDTDSRGYQLGVSLLGLRSGYHGDAAFDRDDERLATVHTASFHAAEDATVLVGRRDRRVAVVSVGGALGDDALTGFNYTGAVSETPSAPIHRQLERALKDPLTRGVLLDLRGASGMAQIEELRPRIARLRAAGKPVVAYMEAGGRRADFFLASACDRVVTTPRAAFYGLGLRVERRYYRKLLADWGVRLDRASYGEYKSAYRNYSVDSTSAADRESTEGLLDTAQELFVSAVSADRHIDRERLLGVLDGRWWSADEMKKAGLVDSVGYREEALAVLGGLAKLGAKPHTVRYGNDEVERAWTVPTRIAVVYATGSIETGTSGNDLLLGPYLGHATLARQIRAAFRRPGVEAVVLRVESPGGSSLGSDLMRHAIERAKRDAKKPLIVSMGSVAASGGYEISLPGDKLFANRYTYTGSIGVLYVKPSLQGWYQKHDVRQDVFERGRYMRGSSMASDWDPETQASADSAIRSEYHDFVATVATARGLEWNAVDQVARGRVWFGEAARERRLVDEIGGLEAALAEARRRAGIPASEKIRLAEYRRPGPGLLGRLVGPLAREMWERSVRLPEPGEVLRWDDAEIP